MTETSLTVVNLQPGRRPDNDNKEKLGWQIPFKALLPPTKPSLVDAVTASQVNQISTRWPSLPICSRRILRQSSHSSWTNQGSRMETINSTEGQVQVSAVLQWQHHLCHPWSRETTWAKNPILYHFRHQKQEVGGSQKRDYRRPLNQPSTSKICWRSFTR